MQAPNIANTTSYLTGQPKHLHRDTPRSRPQTVSHNFHRIRQYCEGNVPFDKPVDARPQALASHRRAEWPRMTEHPTAPGLVKIYDVVRETGVPNAMGARIRVPSNLNIPAWEFCLDLIGHRGHILEFVKYGFPMGYAGPISDTVAAPNHPSATDYPTHIDEFVEKELSLGALVGPFATPPFRPWCHISPLMSREKGDTGKRRVITDMTYPQDKSINAYIVKNGVYGFEYAHSLPTVEALADAIRDMGKGVYLSSIDVSRAYKNFVSDPLDWPLLCFAWKNMAYCDLSMPFGARASSFHMQTVANCITSILELYGIQSFMYLDDLVILSPDRDTAWTHYLTARQLLKDLGLPEAEDKAQPPSTSIKWLGVIVDAANMTLSIPSQKVKTILNEVHNTYHKSYITKRQLQSLLGYLLFVAKCVRPARTFVSRILNAMRGASSDHVVIDDQFRADLSWFLEFCMDWNGVGIIPPAVPTRTILVDACLSGIGATDGQWAYGQELTPHHDGARNIRELEMANVIVALHTFITEHDRGTHVLVRCDDEAAVSVLKTGRAENPVLQECARAAWMIQAHMGVCVSYDHIPGRDNDVADALSRAHISIRHGQQADSLVTAYGLRPIMPCMFFLHNTTVLLYSRSGVIFAPTTRRPTPGGVTSPRNHQEPQIVGGHIRGIHGILRARPAETINRAHMRVPGVCRTAHPGPGDHPQQDLPREVLPQAGRPLHGAGRPPQGEDGPGSIRPQQSIHQKGETPPARQGHGTGHYGPTGLTHWQGGARSRADHLLRRAAPVRSGASHHPGVFIHQAPHERRLQSGDTAGHAYNKVGQELAEGGTSQDSNSPQYPSIHHVPVGGHPGQHMGRPIHGHGRPAPHVPRNQTAHPRDTDQKDMGQGPKGHWTSARKVITAQLKKNSCNAGPLPGLYRGGNPMTWGVEVHRLQGIYRHPNWSGHGGTRGLNN